MLENALAFNVAMLTLVGLTGGGTSYEELFLTSLGRGPGVDDSQWLATAD